MAAAPCPVRRNWDKGRSRPGGRYCSGSASPSLSPRTPRKVDPNGHYRFPRTATPDRPFGPVELSRENTEEIPGGQPFSWIFLVAAANDIIHVYRKFGAAARGETDGVCVVCSTGIARHAGALVSRAMIADGVHRMLCNLLKQKSKSENVRSKSHNPTWRCVEGSHARP
jgi:hypothetical protein